MKLKTVTLRGYKSIASLENFELRNLNVLIGANGAGKSNFIGIFKLLAALADGNLQTFVQKQGGPDALLQEAVSEHSKLMPKSTLSRVIKTSATVIASASFPPLITG